MLWVHIMLVGLAQEAPAPAAGPTFRFDQVLVATIQTLDPALEPVASRLQARLSQSLAEAHAVIGMSDVPGFEGQEVVDATLYLRACPAGEYGGCALVVGQRSLADWVVGGTLEAAEPPADAPYILTVYLVDVNESREVTALPVPIRPASESTAVRGIAAVFADVKSGRYDPADPRDPSEADRRAIEAARKQLMGDYLEEVEEELGELEPGGPLVPIPKEPVTLEEVQRKAESEEIPAWERAGLSPRAYVRYLNSGEPLERWQREAKGRQGRIVARVSAAAGRGPWHQTYAARLLRSAEDLQPIHVVQVLEVASGPTLSSEMEFGVGLLPWLDLTIVGGLHTGTAEIVRDEQVDDDRPFVPGEPTIRQLTTYHFGLRATVAPFPHPLVRPTVSAGYIQWRGAGIATIEPYPELAAPQRGLLQLLPGVELDTAPRVAGLFVRGGLEIPLFGTAVRVTDQGGGLEDPPRPGAQRGIGWLLGAGVHVRVGPDGGAPE